MPRSKKTVSETIVNAVPKKPPETGIDTSRQIVDKILDATVTNNLDLGSIDSLVQSAQNREQSYELIDAMSQDDVIAAALEVYTEYTTQTNDKGQTVWVESKNQDILDYVSWLIESLNIDKHIYQWVYCLVTYGDVYLRLFRESDVQDDILFKNVKNRTLNESKSKVDEDVKLKIYQKSDKYIPYVQMVDNPGEMFDLQKFGKTHGYIKAPIRVIQQSTSDEMYNYLTRYNVNQKDIEIYDATSFVHACLENTNQRQPETVQIFLDNNYDKDTVDENGELVNDAGDSMSTSYSVKRGQSILYNSFRVWRELNLLELSALLNRLTKSSVVRIVSVNVGDMPKEQVQNYMQRLKEKIEQKSAINTGKSMQDYTAAGPIENTIYVPVYGQNGSISAQNIGGDFDPKSLVDLEYFRNKLMGSIKVPKQFLGFTDDATGFNGGSSLTIISSRFGTTIKRLQNTVAQMITDLVNLFLIDRGMDQYVNKFKIRMQTPVTQEEIDRRSNIDNRIKYIGDVMGQLSDVEDPVIKLKIYRSLMNDLSNDSDLLKYLDEYIEKLENPPKKNDKEDTAEKESSESDELPNMDDFNESIENDVDKEPEEEKEILTEEGAEEDSESELDSYMPSPAELDLDLTDSNDIQ